jgi:5-methylcytosine-specific restriction endonuclease McrA
MGGLTIKSPLDSLTIKILKHDLYSKHNYCEICGTNKNLTIHHKEEISNHPEKIFDEENCQVVCRKCHDKIHKMQKHGRNIMILGCII